MLVPTVLLLAPLLAFEERPPLPGTIGLLTPTFEDSHDGCVRPVGMLELHRRPDRASAVSEHIEFIRQPGEGCTPYTARIAEREVPTRESSYEEIALVVLEARAGWYRIALANEESAWVQPSAAFRYSPLRDLLVDGLDAFTPAWDGWICDAPDVGCTRREVPEDATVRVLQARESGGETWWRIEVTTPSCDGPLVARVLQRGWVPAHDRHGVPSVWFFSRGC